MLTLIGGFGIIIQLFVFPPVTQKLGALRCMRIMACINPIPYFLTPYTALLPTAKSQKVCMFIIMMMKTVCTTFSFPCCTILLTNSASSLRSLGTLNGIGTTVSALGRAIGPFIIGAIFTWGAKHNMIIAPYVVLSLSAAINIIPVFMMEEGKGFGDDAAVVVSESDEELEIEDAHEDSGVVQFVDEDADESEFGVLSPLLSRTSSISKDMSDALETDDELDVEDVLPRHYHSFSATFASRNASRRDSRSSARVIRRRTSVPIGLGRGFQRYSSNLGQSLSGFGTGGGPLGG